MLNISTIWVAQQQIVKIKSRIAMAKGTFDNMKTLFISKLDPNLRTKLVKQLALHGAETWTLRKLDQKYLASSEMW
jgi:hypothetical protein